MHKGRMIYTFVSSAYFIERNWGYGMPIVGMKRIAKIAHKNNIPVTWLVNGRSASEGKNFLTKWHEEYGDDVGLYLGAPPHVWCGKEELSFFKNLSYEEMKALITKQKKDIETSLSWAKIKLAGGGYRSNTMIAVLEDLDFDGLWGHCWEQSYCDNITDKGTLWGFYYASRDCYKAPAKYKGKVLACEWTARDLNKAFHSGKPERYSTDPNDALNNYLCNGREIEYWKQFFQEYHRNIYWNDFIPFLQHQEAHEMENTEVCSAYSQEVVDNTLEMLDEFFKYIQGFSDVEIMPAPKALAEYKNQFSITNPTYMIFSDIPLSNPDYKTLKVGKEEGKGPWSEVFIYGDTHCQIFFDKGKTEPVLIRNYDNNPSCEEVEFAKEKEIPLVQVQERIKRKSKEIIMAITAKNDCPSGIVLWSDFSKSEVKILIGHCVESPSYDTLRSVQPENIKKIGKELLFVKLALKKGENKIKVSIGG